MTVDMMANQPTASHAVKLNGCQPLYRISPPASGTQKDVKHTSLEMGLSIGI